MEAASSARSKLPAAVVVVVLAVALRVLYGAGSLGYDASFALVWGRQLLHGEVPDFGVSTAPTPHPLANLASAPLSLFGDTAFPLVVLITIVSMAALAWFCFRLGEKLFTPVVGVVFALVVLTRPSFVNETGQALIDVPFLALVAAAGCVALDRRRPRLVLVLLALAGLLRPEAWPLAVLSAAREWRAFDGRHVQLVALALAAPVVWAFADLAVTGDPFFSLHGTQDLAAELHRPRSTHSALVAAPQYLKILLEPSVAWVGLAGAVAAVWFLYERARLPAAVVGLGLIGFIVLGSAGLPVLTRYLLLPALMLALFAAVAAAGWTAVERGSDARTAWIAAGVLASLVLLATLPATLHKAHNERRFLDRRQAVVRDLHALIKQPRARVALAHCPRLGAPDHRPVPLLAYWLHREPSAIPQEAPSPRSDTAYVVYASAAARAALSLAGGPFPPPPPVPPDLREVGRNRSWAMYSAC